MPDLAQAELVGLAYEPTERGEALVSLAKRFHAWAPNDRRWGYLAALWMLIDAADSAECTASEEPEVDRAGRLARATLSVLDGADALSSEGDMTNASMIGLLLRGVKIMEAETFAIIAEAGARRTALEVIR